MIVEKIYLGIHYWYDNRLDANCDTFFPVFLLYNKGKLTGFGWVAFGKFEYTKRTEFPPLAAITVSLKKFPFIKYTFQYLVIFKTCSNMYPTAIY
jgi:hypothetical protein